MKKVLLLILVLLLSNEFVSGQSAKDMVYKFAKAKDFLSAANNVPLAAKENYKDFDFMVLAGDIYSELEKLDSALIFYNKADDIERNEPIVLRKTADVLSRLGKHKDAIEKVKDAIKEENNNVYNYLAMGDVYLAADSLKQAEIFITKAREMNKKIPEPYIALGDLYFAQRVYELAKNNYEEALSIDEANVEARSKLAISYYWLANREYDQDLANEYFKKSLQEWNIITKQDTMNARAYFEQGKILFFSKIWDNAAQSLYRYVQLRPNGSLGRWYLAQSLYELAQCDSAEPHLAICAQEIDSISLKAKLLLARCYFDAKKYSESSLTFENILTGNKLETADLKRYAGAVFMIADTLKSLKIYEDIIGLDSSECKIIFQTGVMYFSLKKYPDAVRLFKARSSDCDDNMASKANYYTGMSYLLNEKPDSAIFHFLKGYELDSTNLRALLSTGDALAKLNNNDSAIYYYEFVAKKAAIDTSTYLAELGNAYQKICGIYLNDKKAGPLKNTAVAWTKVLPENAYGYLYLATSYQLSNDLDNACKNYKLVLKYDPTNKFAKDMLPKLNCP